MGGLLRRGPATPLLAVVVVTFTACMVAGAGAHPGAKAVSNVGSLLMMIAAGGACLLRAARRRGRTGLAWAAIGLGCLSYGLGDAVWTWQESVLGGSVSSPGLSDLGYLGMVPLVALGMLLLPVTRRTGAYRLRSVVDGLMIACSLLLVSWVLVLEPLVSRNTGTSALKLALILAYPIGDVVLATVVLFTLASLRRGGQGCQAIVLIGAAAALFGLSDILWTFLTLHGAYESGGLLDIGWFVAFALILLAARRLEPGPTGNEPGATGTAGDPAEEDTRPVGMLVPYAAVIAAVLVSAVTFGITGKADAFFGWCRSALIFLIVVRQLLTLLENRHLTGVLEARVTSRSAELHASEQRYQALVQQSSEAVTVVGADMVVRYQSESIERNFGHAASDIAGRNLFEVVGPAAAGEVAAALREAATGGDVVVIEVMLPHGGGYDRLCEMTVTNLLDDPAVRGYVLNTRDVHDARELQKRLVHEAYHDGLTGLPGRALFAELISAIVADAGRLPHAAVLVLDLDGFKEVNDSLGHAVGDALLVEVAQRLRRVLREGDTVARLGGDEYGILVASAAARSDAEVVAERVASHLRRPFTVNGREIRTRASVGLARVADTSGDASRPTADELIRNADLAMYRAKGAGGDRVTAYDPAMLTGLVERLAIESDLRRALEHGGELVLHYQPTVSLGTGEVTGFEALVRWHHPERGMVPPLDFIGIAESTGLIVPLGRWVLAEACRQAVAWGAGTTARFTMAVNVSVRQFEAEDLSALVAEVLAGTGMPAGLLTLEMTESVLLSDTDENLGQLRRLKALGVRLAMDDFGTGYSSLAYLRRFPLDVLKIDRSFVDRLGADTQDDVLVATIVRLGHSLGMTVVAEGIENPVQLGKLRELDCDLAQGYHLSRPLPAEQAGRTLSDGLAVRAGV